MRNLNKPLRLERRLFISYISITLIAILISFTLFIVSANLLFTYRVEESMRGELDVIIQNLMNNPHSPPSRAINNSLLRMVQSDLILLRDNEVTIVTDLEILEEVEGHSDDLSHLERDYIVMADIVDVNSGSYEIILLSEKGMIKSLNQISLSVLFITSLIGLLIASFLSVYAQYTIARPIVELKDKVKEFRENLVAPQVTTFTRDEIQDLDENLVKMAEVIVKNDRKRRSFFENTSHELKTPLMSIRGYAEGLKDGIFTVDEASEIILAESDSLSTMVESILYLSKLEDAAHDRYQLQTIEVNEFLTGFYYKMSGLVSERGLNLQLKLDQTVKVRIDDDKMIRALSNIVTNAVRYAKSEIIVQTEIREKALIMRIFNDGPPVAEEDLGYLFDRFYKGPKGQSGLGLAIVHSIITAHGGKVEALNVEDGFCMSIELPYEKENKKVVKTNLQSR